MNFRAIAIRRQFSCGNVEPENQESYRIFRFKGKDLTAVCGHLSASHRTGLLMVHIQEGGIGTIEWSERIKTNGNI